VFLDNPLQSLRPGGVIPHPFRIDQRDGPPIADAQTVGARAVDPVEQAKLAHPPLQVGPRFDARLAGTALGLGLVGAEKDVPPHAGDVQIAGALPNAFGIAFGIGHIC